MTIMQYKGHAARVEFDAADRIFVGHIAGINDVIGFHADTVDGLEAAFHEAVDDYIATCAAAGKEPERAYSGKVMFRVSPEVHAKAALAAQLAGKSLNQWAAEALGVAAGLGDEIAPASVLNTGLPALASFSAKPSYALLTPDRTLTRSEAEIRIRAKIIEVNEILGDALSARVGLMLKQQLAWSMMGNFILFGGSICQFDFHEVINEISFLEGRRTATRTRSQSKFSDPRLKSFMHKHIYMPQSFYRNMRDETEKNFDKLYNRDFIPKVREQFPEYDSGGVAVERIAGLLAHTMVLGAFEERVGIRSPNAKSRMTGEWLVYFPSKRGNLYLTLGAHSESKSNLSTLLDRLAHTADEFTDVSLQLVANEQGAN